MRLTRMAAVALTAMAMIAASASAKTITLYYFFKQVSVRMTDAAGHSLNRHTRLVRGDQGDLFGVAYLGRGKHHAKRWTASYHLRCVFRTSTRGTCDGQIAIGGSMLLMTIGNSPSLEASLSRIAIKGGTGVFQGAHGTATSVSPNNTKTSDVTIRVRI
jgi:hypothetical protein